MFSGVGISMDGKPRALAGYVNQNVKLKKSRTFLSYQFQVIIYLLGFFLIGLSLWTWRFFGRVSVDQAIWTISFGMQGVLSADSVYFRRFITWCIVWPVNLTLFVLLLDYFASKINKKIPLKFSYIILIIGLAFFAYEYHISSYARFFQKPEKDYFQLNYVDANNAAFHANQPKSLVLIYVESLENTYANAEIFDRDLLKQLNALKKHHLSFEQFKQVSGTGWTIGGIVSTQCAIPLKSLTILGNNRVGETVSHFLPKVKCLGDILAELGYKNVFMEGSSLFPGGKDKFFASHHYDEIYGKEDWLRKGYQESDMNSWGLPDDELFLQAKYKLSQLIKSNQPFNLTLLTVDTHGVTGQLNKSCKAMGYHDFKGIVECTANLVADFVNHIISQGWLDKVNVVVLGDHLAMSNDVYSQLESSSARTIFNVIISNDKLHKYTDEIVHFDMLPTILDSLGIDYPEHKLGLGYSALYPHQNRLAEKVEEQVSGFSEFYNKLWMPT